MWNIVKHRNWFFILSLVIILPGLVSLGIQQFNLGLDFKAGTVVTVTYQKDVTVEDVSVAAKKAMKAVRVETMGQLGANINSGKQFRIQADIEQGKDEKTKYKKLQDNLVDVHGVHPAKDMITVSYKDVVNTSAILQQLQSVGLGDTKVTVKDTAGVDTAAATTGTIFTFSAGNADDAKVKQIETALAKAKGSDGKVVKLTGPIQAEDSFSHSFISPVVAQDLTNNALKAIGIACVFMLLFIWFRFRDYKFGVSAIIAILHDVLVICGLVSLLRWQIDSTFVAAVLTIVGYSITDTIVIFDRVRENIKKAGRNFDLEELVNKSLWETMGRSIYTVSTVLFVCAALYFFGGESLQIFTGALLIGITSGAYSSLFNAAQLYVVFRKYEDAQHEREKQERLQASAAAKAAKVAAKASKAGK